MEGKTESHMTSAATFVEGGSRSLSLIASMSSTCSAFLNVSDHGRPHFLVYSTQPSAPPSAAGGGSEPAAIAVGSPSTPLTFDGNEQSSLQQIPYVQTRSSSLTSASTAATTNLQGVHSNDRSFASHSFPASQDRAHPSEQSLSDSLRSRFNAVSMRYKESISKGTRGWKERLIYSYLTVF
ncbi:E3 ubiquitin-protein ligase RHF2A [Glycine max]|uniref:E3 ubiquitin-protein ligase RHF2A n=1 Tax=Glycine max TaxID=3847 RepID=UPI0003DE9E97|nr:E3 ubiquitin-protein ligase RHF2A-like [Glycine max]|eukprot:XP_006588218.1 E3 ubiquitin-protein ligase RHF2A-like [Glycine max]